MIDPKVRESLLKTRAAGHWQRFGLKEHHGIVTPLFSLHSEKSAGIGEFLDLIPLIQFASEIGLDVIQLLPLNDTGRETSPYSALSSLALNPIHLSLHALEGVERVASSKERLAFLKGLTKEGRVDYPRVFHHKLDYLRDYFNLVFAEVQKSEAYGEFVSENLWLENYALFKAIKETQEWRQWEMWPTALRSPSARHLPTLRDVYKTECDYHKFVQFLCFKQMREVKAQAERSNVFLKGDLPILISRDSADLWGARQHFLLNLSAGAPPDPYSKEYQAWGCPVYDWEEIEKDHFNYWKDRIQIAEEAYHLYRLDHVVGFFRIWAIPAARRPSEGNWLPEDERHWIAQGKKVIERLLDFSLMLPVAEDLGTVPDAVRVALKELGVPGTKVMRWERRWKGDEGFIAPADYEPISMTTVSTHDSDTLALWWRHAPREVQALCQEKGWEFRPFLDREKAYQMLWESHHSASLLHINLLQEYLFLFPELCSTNLADERINIPGKVLPTNWSYRFKPSVEALLANDSLKDTIKKIIK